MEAARQRPSHRSKSSNTVASFLLKTFEILENPDFSEIISWAPDNVSFSIKNFQLFAKEVLPRYFRHGNFSSFVRQLNMYDFHKLKQDKHSITFRNELFTRNGLKELKLIKRKAPRNTRPEPGEVASNQRTAGQPKTPQADPNKQSLEHLKRVVEQEVNNSSWLFEKSMKQLQRIVLAKEAVKWEENQLKQLNGERSETTLKSQSTVANQPEGKSTASILDSLYMLKKKCWSAFEQYEELLQANHKGCELKLATFNADCKQRKESNSEAPQPKREKSACSSQQSLATSSHPIQEPESNARAASGFKPFSSHSLNRIACTEETKISSTPLLNAQVS